MVPLVVVNPAAHLVAAVREGLRDESGVGLKEATSAEVLGDAATVEELDHVEEGPDDGVVVVVAEPYPWEPQDDCEPQDEPQDEHESLGAPSELLVEAPSHLVRGAVGQEHGEVDRASCEMVVDALEDVPVDALGDVLVDASLEWYDRDERGVDADQGDPIHPRRLASPRQLVGAAAEIAAIGTVATATVVTEPE